MMSLSSVSMKSMISLSAVMSLILGSSILSVILIYKFDLVTVSTKGLSIPTMRISVVSPVPVDTIVAALLAAKSSSVVTVAVVRTAHPVML